MPDGGAYLDWIAGELTAGRKQWKRGDKILAAFGYTRRRQSAIDLINDELAARGLSTTPPLGPDMPLDRAIRFHLKGAQVEPLGPEDEPTEAELASADVQVVEVAGLPSEESVSAVTIAVEPPVDPGIPAERTLIVGNLKSAETIPVQVSPSAPIAEALTRMDLMDYSQLVVSTGPRDVKGIISHTSIARAFLHGTPTVVQDCLDTTVPRVERTEPLLRVIDLFWNHNVALVIGADKRLAGIVTPWDIAAEFHSMAGPFLLIGQIEDQLRWIIVTKRIDISEAVAASNGHSAGNVVELLTMGELHRILSNPQNWKQTGIRYDRAAFCAELDAVREIRNAVMHFREPSEQDPFGRVRAFATVVQRAYTAVLRN